MPLPDGYTEEDLVGLSESEKKILMGDGEEDEATDLEALANGTDDSGEGEGDGAGDGDGEGGEGDGKGGKAAGEGEEGKDGKDGKPAGKPGAKVADAADEEDGDQGLKFEAMTPADADEQRTKLEGEKSEAFKKLMAGEMEPEAYQAIEKRVSDALQVLLTATITDGVTTKLTEAQVKQTWDAEVKTVVKAAKAAGLDYKGDKDLQAEFDGMVRVYGGIAAQKGMTDDAGLKASKWALQQAHETMLKKHGKAAAADDGKGKDGKSKAGKTADLSGIPPSLRGAPQAATTTGGDDEFAHIDALKGIEKEKALAKLTPEQQDRYLG
ncbi:MAG: hypothetical protein V4614_14920 [Pseudomonadota bacterium]